MVQYTTIKHTVMWYRNTYIGPACTEELACVETGENLLVDKKGDLIPNGEVMFGDRMVTDWDTRSSLNLIVKQNNIVSSEADNIGRHIPDIGIS